MRINPLALLPFCTLQLFAYSDLFTLDLEDLSTIELKNTSATLTKTDIKNIPATFTEITHQDIMQSGARDLDELLEIYVPSFAYMYKVQASQMGMRGIISDRNNKILLLVNDRVMNIKVTDGGAVTERWFTTLGDIQSIKVITGSGSAIYGSGAIAGIISIETFSAKTKDGFWMSAKGGGVDKFYNFEMSYAGEFLKKSNIYFYYALEKDSGASRSDAPMKFAFDYGRTYTNKEDKVAPADKVYDFKTTNDKGVIDNILKQKAHLQIEKDNFTFWLRYTKSSLATPTSQVMYYWLNSNNYSRYYDTGTLNQQLTLFAQQKQKINSNLDLTYQWSYLKSDFMINFIKPSEVAGGDKFVVEDNTMVKLLANYTLNTQNLLAIGAEYNYNRFGSVSNLFSQSYSKTGILDDNTKWSSKLISLYGEYQAHFLQKMTMFLGTRVDKHQYAPLIFSPRIDFVYNNADTDIVKFGFNRSIRNSDEAIMYKTYMQNATYSDVEKIDTFELSYLKYKKNFLFDMSCFYNIHHVVAWNAEINQAQNIGTIRSYGTELTMQYKRKEITATFSHSYTKLDSFTLEDKTMQSQNISASVYGYGDDFANWHNHISKFRILYKPSSTLEWNNSLRIFWGMDGAKDMANYNKDLNLEAHKKYRLAYYDDTHTQFAGKSVYLDSSFVYHYSEQTNFLFYGYNLLGLIDKDYNKRNFFQTTTQYRDSAPSFSVGVVHKF